MCTLFVNPLAVIPPTAKEEKDAVDLEQVHHTHPHAST